jgi:predicted O-methyltransferase YrrM
MRSWRRLWTRVSRQGCRQYRSRPTWAASFGYSRKRRERVESWRSARWAAYSTISLARALPPDGCVVSLELEPGHAEVARKNIEQAGLQERVRIKVGDATQSLAEIIAMKTAPFDFIFLDANKDGYPEYLKLSLQLSRPGTLIVVDNIVRKGAVIDGISSDANVQGVRRMLDLIAAEPRVSATAVQTVGSKGYDGFVLARVTS